MEKTINLWVFWYNAMIHESSSFPVSYHRTKQGAIKAMKSHKSQACIEHNKNNERHKVWCKDNSVKYKPISRFGAFEHWSVEKFNLLIED